MSSDGLALNGSAEAGNGGQAASRRWLWAVLAATLAASVWALSDGEAEGDLAAARKPAPRPAAATRAARSAAAASAPEPVLQLPQRTLQLTARPDLFAEAQLAPPPPPPPPAATATAAPPPPPPPTLPYTFGGRLITDKGPSVLLHEGTQTHVLAKGGTLGSFRLEEDAGSRIEFVYVPTGERVVLVPAP